MPSFLSSRPNWVPPHVHPYPQASVASLPKGGDTLARGVRGPNSDEGTDTLVLYVYYNPSTYSFIHGFLSIWQNDARGGRCGAEPYDRKPGPL